ncbi:MAG: WG repeat-containing protein [Odoribacter splanchnicus]|nr:WG repeat-containing protein [Odoribacter splanchnicus]
MKTILIYILTFTFHISLFAQSGILYKVTDPSVAQWERGDGVGYADASGNMIIPFGKYRYCYSETFDKIAFVDIANRDGIYAIDRNENVLFKVFISDNGPDPIKENTFRIVDHDKIGFADINGNVIISPQFDAAWSFQEGFAGVSIGGTKKGTGEFQTYTGKWKFIDKTGRPINNEEYDDIRPFSNGTALVMKDGKWGKINQNGVLVVPLKYTFNIANQQ